MTSSNLEAPVVFRALALADIPSLSRWLADPDVARWWREDDIAEPALVAKYSARIDGTEPVRAYVIVIDNNDVGFIQAYRLADHPEYARQLPVSADAVAIDLYIGESSWRGKGWGAKVLRQFLDRVVFGEYNTEVAVIAPEPANRRAIATYERVGFRWIATVRVIDDDASTDAGDEYVMTLRRDSPPDAHSEHHAVAAAVETRKSSRL